MDINHEAHLSTRTYIHRSVIVQWRMIPLEVEIMRNTALQKKSPITQFTREKD